MLRAVCQRSEELQSDSESGFTSGIRSIIERDKLDLSVLLFLNYATRQFALNGFHVLSLEAFSCQPHPLSAT